LGRLPTPVFLRASSARANGGAGSSALCRQKSPEPNKTIPIAGIPLQPLARKAGALLKNKTTFRKDYLRKTPFVFF